MLKNNKPTLFFLLVMTLLGGIGLISTDIFLPAMPAMGKELGISPQHMQQLVSIYLFSFAIFQLVYGPLSDAFGRRPMLMTGFIFVVASSLLCALSSDFSELFIFRFIQGLGACAGVVMMRVMIADLFDAEGAAKVFAFVSPAIALFPALAPTLGGMVAYHIGWRYTFGFVAMVGMLILVLTFFYIKETNATPTRTIQLKEAIRIYATFFSHRRFLIFTALICGTYTGYFAFITVSAYVFHQMGYTVHQIGFFYIPWVLAFISGTFTERVLIRKVGIEKTMALGVLLFLLSGAMFVAMSVFHWMTLGWVEMAACLMTFGNGILIPLTSAQAITSCPKYKGYTSGLLGCLQLSAASLGSYIASLSETSLWLLGMLILLMGLLMAAVLIFYVFYQICVNRESAV